ncbi:unnamed protein product [Echinostoma caproni]|uniref:Uncharacterized protein n=1 Tax=Echinostoma caproni TaxID=27848 RepID=A0A183AZY1_9TREM|nr:unnamed protein product [Echinostoma caproni]
MAPKLARSRRFLSAGSTTSVCCDRLEEFAMELDSTFEVAEVVTEGPVSSDLTVTDEDGAGAAAFPNGSRFVLSRVLERDVISIVPESSESLTFVLESYKVKNRKAENAN